MPDMPRSGEAPTSDDDARKGEFRPDWHGVPEQARTDFIRRNTESSSPPLIPEVRLHLAAASLPLWQSTEEELGALNLPPPFWAFAWAGGQALARYLLDNPGLVRGRSVIDVGAGSGLCAIAAALCHAGPVLAADIDPLACSAMRMNSAANGVEVAVSAEDLLAHAPPQAGVVLAGDLFYEQTMSKRVLWWLERAARSGSFVLAGDPGRSYFPAGRFKKVASYDVPVTRELESQDVKPTSVWQLVARQGS